MSDRAHHAMGTCWCGELHAAEHVLRRRVDTLLAERDAARREQGLWEERAEEWAVHRGELATELRAAERREQRLREAGQRMVEAWGEDAGALIGAKYALEAALVAEPEQAQDEQEQGLGDSAAARSGGEPR